jgi:hypothetical protein
LTSKRRRLRVNGEVDDAAAGWKDSIFRDESEQTRGVPHVAHVPIG